MEQHNPLKGCLVSTVKIASLARAMYRAAKYDSFINIEVKFKIILHNECVRVEIL